MRATLLGLLVALPLVLPGAPLPAAQADRPTPAHEIVNGVDLDAVIENLTLEEKVGQLLFVGFSGTRVTPPVARLVRGHKVGGVVLFSRNIDSPAQVGRLCRDLQALMGDTLPPFIAVDQEGGNVVRLRERATILPSNMAIGATRSPPLAYLAGQALAVDLANIGFNMNLAPVLDVNSNPRNPVIGIRSFGEDPQLVATLGTSFVRGLQENGIVAVAKHFPGHGDTQTDSHFGLPQLPHHTLHRLEEVELAPFRAAIGAGLDAIMTAHIALPEVTREAGIPATLSPRILTDLLREELGFDGIVITDGLEMQGIDHYGTGQAAVRAIKAGADMVMVLWIRKNKEQVYEALLQAVRSGEIPEERLDTSIRRILRVKFNRGLLRRIPPTLAQMDRSLDNPLHQGVVREIARRSVTVVRNQDGLLPLSRRAPARLLFIAPEDPFLDEAAAMAPGVRTLRVPHTADADRMHADLQRARSLARGAEVVVIGVVNRSQARLAQELQHLEPEIPLLVVSLGSPYYLGYFPTAAGYLCVYSSHEYSQRAAIRALFGAPAPGRLPVTIPGYYPFGHRDQSPKRQARRPSTAAR